MRSGKWQRLAPLIHGHEPMREEPCTDFATTFAAWVARARRQLGRNLFESYHPERHYMRGPGPKWREKQAQPPSGAAVPQLGISDLSNAGA